MHKKRFICPYILYCLNTSCMKLILRIHLSDSLENAMCPACNEDKWRVSSCLWFLLSGQHRRSLLMLVLSLVDRCLPHREELAARPEAVGRGVTQLFFCGDDSSGRCLGPMGTVLGGNFALLQRISKGLWCSWPFTWQLSSTPKKLTAWKRYGTGRSSTKGFSSQLPWDLLTEHVLSSLLPGS